MNDIEVIDVAFGNGCNAAYRVVIPRYPQNKNRTKLGTLKSKKRENGQYRERDEEK